MKHPHYSTLIVLFILNFSIHNIGLSQCTNTTKNPTEDVIAPQYNEPMVVTTEQWAGDYYLIKNLSIGDTYEFSSDSLDDYITIRDADGLVLVTHGSTPLTYTVTGDDILTVHINLTTPPCGSQSEFRTTRVTCTSCLPIPPGVGIGTTDPEAVLDVSGEIKVSNSVSPPEAGMIRWNPSTEDFEGYNGSKWISLTRANSNWGLVHSTAVSERQKSTAGTDGALGDYFGKSVSIFGDYAIVGADGDDDDGSNSGSAYIFHRTGMMWTKQAKITAGPDGAASDIFGRSVSISGDYAIVGASGDDDDGSASGSAYIFHRTGTTWTKQTKIIAGSEGDEGDNFGCSVSIFGDDAIVGAQGDDDDGSSSGSAYIFHRTGTTWTKQAKITAGPDGAAGDYFGIGVSLSGDYAIVGASGDDDDGSDSGSAYIFHRTGTTWTKQAKIGAGSDGDTEDYFGASVSLSGNLAIVGAYLDDDDGSDSGSAYIFQRIGTFWAKQAKITAGIYGAASNYFGRSVSLSGDQAIVGASGDATAGISAGSAYIYRRSGTNWYKQAKIFASDGTENDLFGYRVSISGDDAIVGAYLDDDDGDNSGSVYFFSQ